jgi:hypothetical protein
MTTKAEWIALAERCEKATGHDRDIDARIEALVNGRLADARAPGWTFRAGLKPWQLSSAVRGEFISETSRPASHYTASLDAITTLIERELPEVQWLCRPDKEGGFGNLYRRRNPDRSWPCFAFTPALALCAAFCRAMADKVTT